MIYSQLAINNCTGLLLYIISVVFNYPFPALVKFCAKLFNRHFYTYY